MPMKTMLDRAYAFAFGSSPSVGERRPFAEVVAGDLHLATISAAVRLRTSGLGAGVAEGAVQRAADLAGDAERAAARRRG